ncbi:MAG: DUF4124 domain-containing protein [Pseudoxanthomonas sp.]|nr:DUF4124 domain-containing protein [Pseudoxanthomonas sp.]
MDDSEMGKMALFCVFLAFSGVASAQSIYKCRDAKGGAVYQSDPCPEAEKRWDTQPRDYTWDDYYKRQAAEASIARDRRIVRQRNAAQQPVAVGIGASRPSGAAIPAVTTSCQSARQQRDRMNEVQGINRTYAGSRVWDQAVWDACK